MKKMSLLFGPQSLILLGAILAAIGALWSSQQQSEFERKLNAKNEQLLLVTQDTLANITGGDSFPSADPILLHPQNIFQLLITNHGNHDLHDLDVQMSSARKDIFPTRSTPSAHFIASDTFTASIKLERLPKKSSTMADIVVLKPGVNYDYAINFHSRNGHIHQRLRVRQFNEKWEYALFVRRGPVPGKQHGEVLHMIKSDGFDLSTLDEKWPQKIGDVFLY